MPESMLLDILRRSATRRSPSDATRFDRGVLVDPVPFPFLAIVGQTHMKLALILSVINPHVGGVLLIGPRGTAKTVAVRGLVDVLPSVERSACQYGCEPEAARAYGMDAVCDECAAKLARGEPITYTDRMRLTELPLNARLDDVVGAADERIALEQSRIRLDRGILARADRNILYIDEVNLLQDEIVNAILDAAAQGRYTVRRGPVAATYRARFVLIGSMNPEEGRLRPQIMDRIGLHVVVRGLPDTESRLQVYTRVRQYQDAPHSMAALYAEDTLALANDIDEARELLPRVRLAPAAQELILEAVKRLGIASHRAEIYALEAARAHAAADGRTAATEDDVRAVALLALRQRRSEFIIDYFTRADEQDRAITETLDEL